MLSQKDIMMNHLFGMRLCKLLYQNKDKNTMIYLRKKNNTAYVVIKGTHRASHWVHNLSVFYKEDGSHTGFSQFSDICKKEIYNDMIDFLDVNDSYISKIKNLYFVSHSLGASALIILIYNEMLNNEILKNITKDKTIDIVLLGAPKSGNKVFTQNFNKILEEYSNVNIYRYNIENDFISEFPPMMYQHICEDIKMNDQKTLFNLIYNHSLNNYIKNLKNVMKEHDKKST